MRSSIWVPAITVAAGLAWTVGAAAQLTRVGHTSGFILMEFTVAWVFLVSGLVVWTRRPSNRCGWLLVAAGFAWPVGAFAGSGIEALQVFGFAFSRWYDFLLAWALLAYPTGSLRTRHDRALVVVLGSLFALRTFSRLFLFVGPDLTGCDCVENRFLPVTDDRYWRWVEDLFIWGLTVGTALVLLSCFLRWRAASAAGRRMLLPALVASSLLLLAVLSEAGTGWNALMASVPLLRTYVVSAWSHAAVAVALVLGFVRLDHLRTVVVDLVGELGGDLPPERLTLALRQALGDSNLSFLTWSADAHAYVDERNQPVSLPDTGSTRAVTFIEWDGHPRAALVHEAALLEDPGLVGAVAAAIRLTRDNAALEAENSRQLAELASSRARIVRAADEERHRIERDLHDGAQQRLVSIALSLRLLETRMQQEEDADVLTSLRTAIDDLTEALEDLRDLARGIHPAVLTEAGLAKALESLVDRSSLTIDPAIDVPDGVPADVAAAAYFVASEALANAAKHSGARRVSLTATVVSGRLNVVVEDDGVGGASLVAGGGLVGLADRVAAAGGSLSVTSTLGAGTRIEVDLPCALS
jgi:signal transduction histidine kinase